MDGTLDVPDEEKITRTIAIDRTRKIRFAIEKREFGEDELKEEASVPFSGGRELPTDAPKKTEEVKR